METHSHIYDGPNQNQIQSCSTNQISSLAEEKTAVKLQGICQSFNLPSIQQIDLGSIKEILLVNNNADAVEEHTVNTNRDTLTF